MDGFLKEMNLITTLPLKGENVTKLGEYYSTSISLPQDKLTGKPVTISIKAIH
ncbi:hypothetical protein [Flammeovirga kamogawensis]|uniref:Uncharacterized protein n=1 Tax=Flammeovirga kamogawensis TaxID=373891 RepID=A0ABX8H0L4_9BACT|nr:hypothetical protein [Flammeovirga kamogawensis]MBB6462228.1 hypothetical protein [Flammeovirga kamogawensis]QWG09371.1 hypothetical protein KM029_22455 [Flammeovirga kamogawensis]